MSIAQPRSLPIEELKTLIRRMLVALGEDPEREGLEGSGPGAFIRA